MVTILKLLVLSSPFYNVDSVVHISAPNPLDEYPGAFLLLGRDSAPLASSIQTFLIGNLLNFEYHYLRLKELAVSRQHALICYYDNDFYVLDLGSTHGTNVNGSRLSPTRQASVGYALKNMDIIEIGSTRFQVHRHPTFGTCDACSHTKTHLICSRVILDKKDKQSQPIQPRIQVEVQRRRELSVLKKSYLGYSRKPCKEYVDRAKIRRMMQRNDSVDISAEEYRLDMEDRYFAGAFESFGPEAPLSRENKGRILLEKMSWKGGGLGKTGNGIQEPLALRHNGDRSGLGSND